MALQAGNFGATRRVPKSDRTVGAAAGGEATIGQRRHCAHRADMPLQARSHSTARGVPQPDSAVVAGRGEAAVGQLRQRLNLAGVALEVARLGDAREVPQP